MSEVLKIRGERFLETAKELYKKEYFDLCAFNLEQAVQLFLKYSIWKILGDFEKTHDIFTLLGDYKKASNKEKEIDDLVKNFEETINDLEVAYIEARYLEVNFTKNQIDKMFEFLEELKKILNL
jgi:HEPN domain-containing protein